MSDVSPSDGISVARMRTLTMRGRRGFVLLVSLLAVTFLTLAGTSFLTFGVWQARASTRLYNRSSALHLAEAGLAQASRNLQTPSTTDDITTQVLSTGRFELDAPVSLGASMSRVTSHGISGSEQRQLEAVFRLTGQSIFRYALFGDQNLSVSGSAITDSYDSSEGAYNDDESSPGYNAGHDGDVGTNASTAGGVAVSGSIFIDGQVAVGYQAADPYSVMTGYNPVFITGGTDPPTNSQDVVAQSSAFSMPAVTIPTGLSCSDFMVTGNTTVTLSPTGGPLGTGVYCYDDLTIQGGGALTASGSVTVYLTGALMARGNSTVGVPSSPTSMVFLMNSSSEATLEEGTLTGSTKFYGALYGPSASITISGDADLYGSIIAKSVSVTGSASIHYDEAMSDVTQVTNTFTTSRIAWRER